LSGEWTFSYYFRQSVFEFEREFLHNFKQSVFE